MHCRSRRTGGVAARPPSDHRSGARDQRGRGHERDGDARPLGDEGEREPAEDLADGLGLREERVHGRAHVARRAAVHPDHADGSSGVERDPAHAGDAVESTELVIRSSGKAVTTPVISIPAARSPCPTTSGPLAAERVGPYAGADVRQHHRDRHDGADGEELKGRKMRGDDEVEAGGEHVAAVEHGAQDVQRRNVVAVPGSPGGAVLPVATCAGNPKVSVLRSKRHTLRIGREALRDGHDCCAHLRSLVDRRHRNNTARRHQPEQQDRAPISLPDALATPEVRSEEVSYRWRGPLTDAEMVELVAAHGGTSTVGWWDRIRPHSLGWVTARARDDALVGFVNVVSDGGDHAFLIDTKTHCAYQRRGIGTHVVRFAAQHAKAAGCEWLHVDFDAGLASFYFNACGFRPTEAGLIHLPSFIAE
jgi:ribosomal protein S18 acetylase RimI-like enzyme